MSKIRTAEQLSDRLAEDLVWRKKELSELKRLIEAGSLSRSKNSLLLRSGITMLYAHWEGYIKTAASSYLEFVALRKLRYDELASNFVAIAFKTKLSEANVTRKATVFTQAVDFMRSQLSQRSEIQYKEGIDTALNLSSEILQEIMCMLGLEYAVYETKQVLIDERLLKRRNCIAHGEFLSLDKADYLELQQNVIEMLEEFRRQIEDCVRDEKFKYS